MRALKHKIMALALMLCMTLSAAPAFALGFIRDAEIESTLRRMADPIFQAAGLPPSSVDIFIINDRALNAFIAGGRNMAFHSGLLQTLETPSELMSVIAHETGHIAGGHLARRRAAQRNAYGPMVLGMLLGVAAAAAGSSDAGAAIITGGQQIAARNFLKYSRNEESTADQAALSYLERVRANPQGMINVLEKLRARESLALAGRRNAYAQTHPLTRERIANAQTKVNASPLRGAPEDPELAYWHDRMRAKLDGFLNGPDYVLVHYPNNGSEFSHYARAVAQLRLSRIDAALAEVDALLRLKPADPYYWELKGQILYEGARPLEAAGPYERAVALAPEEPLLRVALAQAYLARDGAEPARRAAAQLRQSIARDRLNPQAWRSLSIASARMGDEGWAALSAAELQALGGKLDAAKRQARRAQQLLPNGSPGWLRASDILALEDQ